MHDPVAMQTDVSLPVKDAKKDATAKLPIENGQLLPKNHEFKIPKPNPQEIIKKTEPKEKGNDQSGRVAKEEPKNVVKQSLKQYSDLPEPSFKQTKSNDVFTKPVC